MTAVWMNCKRLPESFPSGGQQFIFVPCLPTRSCIVGYDMSTPLLIKILHIPYDVDVVPSLLVGSFVCRIYYCNWTLPVTVIYFHIVFMLLRYSFHFPTLIIIALLTLWHRIFHARGGTTGAGCCVCWSCPLLVWFTGEVAWIEVSQLIELTIITNWSTCQWNSISYTSSPLTYNFPKKRKEMWNVTEMSISLKYGGNARNGWR